MYEGCLTNDRWKNKWPTHPHYFPGFISLVLTLVLISALDISPTLRLWGQHLLLCLWPSEANSYPWSYGGNQFNANLYWWPRVTFSTVLCSARKSHGTGERDRLEICFLNKHEGLNLIPDTHKEQLEQLNGSVISTIGEWGRRILDLKGQPVELNEWALGSWRERHIKKERGE